MDKAAAAVVGTLIGLAQLGSARAAPAAAHATALYDASSYRELLAPIPNAAARLHAAEAAEAPTKAQVEPVHVWVQFQFGVPVPPPVYYGYGYAYPYARPYFHHHHHHHHQYYRYYGHYHHHHHHHH